LALDAAALSALLWFSLRNGDSWWNSFALTFGVLGCRQIYLPMWQGLKSMITGGDVEEKIVEEFLSMFSSRGYPPPSAVNSLNAYLQQTMRNASLPEDLRLEAAGLYRELELARDVRTYEDNVAKRESAEEAFRRFKETSEKDKPDWLKFDKEEALP
jgi:hypothetical protein